MQHSGYDARREGLNLDVVFLHYYVVMLSGVGDVFFHLFELCHQFLEIGVGLEDQIGFRYCESRTERS